MQRAGSSARSEGKRALPPTGRAGRRAILVLGMHRSGTSAVARVLGLCGADLPPKILPPNKYNETGYWEPEAVVRLHDDLLSANGSWFGDVNALPSGWHRSELVSAYADRLEEVLEDAYGDAPLWVVKDPRLCRLVPLWRVVLDRLGVEPLVVIPVRNPLEVAASLDERDQFSSPRSLLLWLRHFLEAESATRDVPRSFVSYESLLQDWRGLVDRVGRELAIEWPRSADSAAPDIEAFLDGARRHHASSTGDLAARGDISPWVSETWRWAEKAALGERVSTSALDQTREALDAADLVFPPLYAEWEQDRRRLTNTLSEVAALAAQVRELEGRLSLTSNEAGALRRELAAREARVGELESQHAEHRAELEAARAELVSAGALRRSMLRAAEERHRSALASVEARHRDQLESTRNLARAGLAETRRQWLLARHELRSIQASVSWRLSRPLRWAERRAAAVDRSVGLAFRRRGRRLAGALSLWRDRRLLRESGLFDPRWYLDGNPDVAASRLSPLTHYLSFGVAEGRDPNPLFSTAWYLQQNPDVGAAGMNPLLHYALYGAAEGRDPGPGFDTAGYLARNPDVARSGVNPLAHYLQFGRVENRPPGAARVAPGDDSESCLPKTEKGKPEE